MRHRATGPRHDGSPGADADGFDVNAIFKGKQEDESGWFGIAAGLPFLSIPASRAARGIVCAVRRGQRNHPRYSGSSAGKSVCAVSRDDVAAAHGSQQFVMFGFAPLMKRPVLESGTESWIALPLSDDAQPRAAAD